MSNEELERLGRQRPEILKSWLVEVSFVTTVVLSMMMSEYFISGFFICLPAVAVSLDMPDSVRTWPAAVINLTTACLLLPFSRLADRHGAKVVFLSGHAWLIVWSLNLVFSLYGAFACIGFYVGIFFGALSAELLTWRWYFWLGCIMCALVFLLGAFSIPRGLGATDPSLGFFLSVLLFALIPKRSSDGDPSISFLYWAYVFPAMICGTIGIDITFNYKGAENVDKDQQFRIGFWTGVALAALAFVLLITVRMGKASASLTADEKAELETAETVERAQDGGEKAAMITLVDFIAIFDENGTYDLSRNNE
uniref:Major facilitator superfamily (MFS) profile domain-containing protein n=1 Tax=Bionectria ochroleuca TaxID=29856 RepID=A0A0B7K8X8_BIOOC